MRYDVVILAILLGIFLWRMNRRARRLTGTRRRAIFDDCQALFSEVSITQDEVNYPILKALYKGEKVTIEPLVDHIAVRKVPTLWLMVTIQSPVQYTGILDYLVRPHNTEFYSPAGNLDTGVDIPKAWPQHAVLRTDNIKDIPPMAVVGRFVARMFSDLNSKELLITPNGVRMVYLLDQAQRSHYMVLRQMVFEHDRLEPQLVERLLGALLELLDDLSVSNNEKLVETVEHD